MFSPSDLFEIPFGDWVDSAVKDWLVPNFRPFFRSLQAPISFVLDGLDGFLNAMPMLVFTAILAFIAWRTAGRGVAIFTALALVFLDLIGVWGQTMTTLAMIVTAVFFCAVIGVPVGILAARSDRFLAILRPILDVMQTIPPFVYLVPIVMLFGVGTVPGVIATIIFALPPIVRLTNLGIRGVRADLVEAAYAFGSTPSQVLWEVQLPLAMRTIMAGLNQTLMMALSMAVIAALIGAGGLGLTVNTGLGRLDVGTAMEGGIGIVILAIILDRITQSFAERKAVATPSLAQTFRGFFKPSRIAARTTDEKPA
jgi:glycine betaine/proline transport system permease protein